MKKQYLISLLWLIAIFFLMGNGLFNINNSNNNPPLEKEITTGIKLDQENSHVFVVDAEENIDNKVSEGDLIDAITINATYNKELNKEIIITKENSLLIYFAEEDPWSITYQKINNYFKDDADGDGIEEGFIPAKESNDGIATFSATIDYRNDPTILPGFYGYDDQSKIWNHTIKDENPYNLSTTATQIVDGNIKENQEFEIGPVSIEIGFKNSTLNNVKIINKTSNSATIKYVATPGREFNGEIATVDEVLLYDVTGDNYKPFEVQENPSDGIIKVYNLKPDTKYEAEVHASFSNQLWEEIVKIDFETKPIPRNSKISPMQTTNLTDSKATINYNVELAKEDEFVSAALYENSKATTKLGTQIDYGVMGNKGTIEVSNLTSDTNYNEAELRVVFKNKGEVVTTIEDLQTTVISKKFENKKIVGIILIILLLVEFIGVSGHFFHKKYDIKIINKKKEIK